MKTIAIGPWIFYVNETLKNKEFDNNKVGKWMYFFNDLSFAKKICCDAVENNYIKEAKHSNAKTGVCCFYLEIDDIESHKKILRYFLDNNLVRKTKTGALYDIAFKLDSQTLSGKYGADFNAIIKLSDFVNLKTGEFIR